ncbi:MAG: hypothetical protein R2752_15540 [Vicinamibacterales bacterium]
MASILRFLQFCVGGCRHEEMYRERRPLFGVDVMHFVCASCGHAVPAVQRTAEDYERVARVGAIGHAHVERRPRPVFVAERRIA